MASSLAALLARTMAEEFANSLAKVSAHKADEERMWNLDERNPQFRKILTEACDLRIEALSNAYLGVIALREVSLRGREFGMEPAQTAAQAFLGTFLGEHGDVIAQWDFEFGEFTPFVRSYANVLLGEAVRLAVTKVKENEVESGLLAVIDFDTRTLQHDMPALLEAYPPQARRMVPAAALAPRTGRRARARQGAERLERLPRPRQERPPPAPARATPPRRRAGPAAHPRRPAVPRHGRRYPGLCRARAADRPASAQSAVR